MAKDKDVDTVTATILTLPKWYSLIGSIKFKFGQEDEKFDAIVERLDGTINEFRREAVKELANQLGVGVRFEQ